MENFIREYLRCGLIDVGDNEERLKTLEDTAASLVTDFVGNPDLLVRFIRTTLVPSVDMDSATLTAISDMVEASWTTFLSVSPDRKIPMLVAVGWQAVFECAKSNTSLLPLVWYASANAIERGGVDETVRLVLGHVESLGVEVETQACDTWRAHAEKTTKQVRSIASPEFKTTLLTSGMLVPTTATNAEGTPVAGGNPHPLNATSPWAQHFATQASQAINSGINAQQKALVAAVQDSFNDLSKKFNVIRDEAIRSHEAQNKRTELLWLAESQYSPRFCRGYDELKGKEAVGALAFDIAEIASGVSPISVEYFLAKQAGRFASGAEIKVETFVKELAKSDTLKSLPESLLAPMDGVPLLGLFEAAGEVNRKKLKAAQIPGRIGFSKTKTMTVGQLSRTLFREIKCLEFMGVDLWS